MNQQIQTALVKVSSFVELESIVKDAKEDITFFGHRYIYVKGYKGTLSIDALALSVMMLVSKDIDFNKNDNEKQSLTKIIPLVSKIYEQNDARWKNPITLTLRMVRDQWNYVKEGGCDLRFFWNACYSNKQFDYFEKHRSPFPESLLSQVTKEPVQSVLSNISSFTDLLPIVRKAKEDISFFGCRYIYIEEYDGTLPINALASRVMELAKSTINFSQDEDYQEIVPLIDAIYLHNDERKKNPFTRVLCSIRDIWSYYIQSNAEGSRFQWEQHRDEIGQNIDKLD